MPPKNKNKNKQKKEESEIDEEDDLQRCKKVKDPCKICLQTVTELDGVQCMGACEAWVHFECLDYTPGRIKDIEDGLITVTCPCPDCKTTVPKEFRTDKRFTCNNLYCPANNPPACEDPKCQANEVSQSMPVRCPPPGTLRTCGVSCQNYTQPAEFQPQSSDRCFDGKLTCNSADGSKKGSNPPQPIPKPPFEGGSGTGLQPTTEVMKQMCKTVGDLAQQLNVLMEKIRYMNAKGGESMSSSTSYCKEPTKKCTGSCGGTKCSSPCRCPGKPIQKR